MFGTVPKNIWSRRIPPDDENRIRLATRSLLIDTGEKLFLADVGNGDKWPEKLRRIYAFESISARETGFDSEVVTDIVLTHLHFDHAGGISRYQPGCPTVLELCYPRARIYLQADNYENAKHPNPRERASYLEENVSVLERAKIVWTHGSQEIEPGIWVHQVNGHTRGHQWLEVKNEAESIVFPADLIPTSHHLPLPFSMGYDISAGTLLEEKEDFLSRAVALHWIVVFEHDPDVAAARVKMDEKGQYALREVVAL